MSFVQSFASQWTPMAEWFGGNMYIGIRSDKNNIYIYTLLLVSCDISNTLTFQLLYIKTENGGCWRNVLFQKVHFQGPWYDSGVNVCWQNMSNCIYNLVPIKLVSTPNVWTLNSPADLSKAIPSNLQQDNRNLLSFLTAVAVSSYFLRLGVKTFRCHDSAPHRGIAPVPLPQSVEAKRDEAPVASLMTVKVAWFKRPL